MFKRIIILPFLFLFISCQDDINVTIVKQPGTVTGIVLPALSNADVYLQQVSERKTKINSSGVFYFDDVAPGVYRLIVKAPGYGRAEIDQVTVKDGEGCDVGKIELVSYPFPLLGISPQDGSRRINANSTQVIQIESSKLMDFDSFVNSISVTPELADYNISEYSSSSVSVFRYIISGKYQMGTEYTVNIDSTAKTIYDENIEFPFSFSFTTDFFNVYRFYPPGYSSQKNIRFRFNNLVGNSIIDYLTIVPETPLFEVRISYDAIDLSPSICWKSDTDYSISLKKDYMDIEGNMMENDTTFYFKTPPLFVARTYPHDGQQNVQQNMTIDIEMNNVVDESTVSNSISIIPNVPFEIITLASNIESRFEIVPDTLYADTEYKISIDTTLTDYFGVNLNAPYTLNFKTK
ncbi:MAG: hypothetical protein HND52_16220 [Ignavibacteriae bacterium]|nr:hypothetical protein [Ignavibacteriota bacterium]NOG99503.1 hypothetical protein [Ignavibacteriota bacterium]